MDRVSLIVAALVGGAAQAPTSDAYRQLKQRVMARFAGREDSEVALDVYHDQPQRTREALSEALAETDATGDDTVLAAAQRVLEEIDPAGVAAGRYSVNLHG